MYKILFISFSLFFSLKASAQNIISGKVVDAVSRQPLEFANISFDNNEHLKAFTDQYGNFSIAKPGSSSILFVSFIGFKPEKITITESKNIIVALQPDVIDLKDIIISQNSGQQKFNTIAKVDLDLKPVRNTQELLRLVPGLLIAQHAGGGKAEQIFLRGFDCDHGTDVQVSVDGMPVNMVSHAHGQGYADSHFIIPETINNIDYGTGPYYTQRGDFNTAGYVSFSTYKNIPKSTVQVEAGRFNTLRTLAMIDLLKKNKDKQSAYLAGDFYYTDGPTINKQHFNRFNVFGKYNYSFSTKTQFAATASGFKSKWDASGQVPERAVAAGIITRFGSLDPSEGGNTERYNVNMNLVHRFTDNTTWENQAFYSRYIFDLYSNFTFFARDPVNGDEIKQAEKRNIIGLLSRINHKNIYSNWTLNSVYGAGLRADATKGSQLSNAVQRRFLSYVKLGDIKESNIFGYMQQQAIAGRWLIEAGVRFDYFHFDYFDRLNSTQKPAQSKSIVSPKLNIQYTVNSQVQLYVKGGKGFHSNDARVVVENGGLEILPAAYGADIGIVLKPTPNFLLNIAAWYLHLNQEFVYVGDEGVVEPSGKTRRQGIDVIARYQFSTNLFANANFNFTKPRAIGEPKGADYIPLAPTFTSVGGIFYKPRNGFNGGLSYRYIKDRPANEDNSIIAKGYFLLDGSFNYTRPAFEVGVALENIFNIDWNEAQFATTSQLKGETEPVTELHYTPGNPFFFRFKVAIFF